MLQRSFLRVHTGTVVLGVPAAPIRYLMRLYRMVGARPVVVARRFPLFLALFPFATLRRSSVRSFSDLLAKELADLAEQHGGKYMRLIPATDEALQFARKYQGVLETSYVIEWTSTEQGDAIS